VITPPQTIYDQCSEEDNASYNAGARLPMDERWYPQSRERTEDERSFVDEHERAVRYSRKACSQLLMRLQSEGPDPLRCRHPGPHLDTHTKETPTMMYQEEWVS
jgi:hypothetical protein